LLAPALGEDATQAVFTAFARFCHRWAVTRLDALDAGWTGLLPLTRAARAAGLRVLPFDHFGNWHEDVAGLDWNGYLAARPGALRETVRRRLRRAAPAFCAWAYGGSAPCRWQRNSGSSSTAGRQS